MNKIMKAKAQFVLSDLPKEIQRFSQYVDSLKYQEKPNYEYLKGLFLQPESAKKRMLDAPLMSTFGSELEITNFEISEKLQESCEFLEDEESKIGETAISIKVKSLDLLTKEKLAFQIF